MSLFSSIFNIFRHFCSSRRVSILIGRHEQPIALLVYFGYMYAFGACVKNLSGILYVACGTRTHHPWQKSE